MVIFYIFSDRHEVGGLEQQGLFTELPRVPFLRNWASGTTDQWNGGKNLLKAFKAAELLASSPLGL